MAENLDEPETGAGAGPREALDGNGGNGPGHGPAGASAAAMLLAATKARRRRTTRWSAGAAVVVAVLVLVAAFVRDGQSPSLRTTTPGTTASASSTTLPAFDTTAVPPAGPAADSADAVWPPAGHRQYDDPVDAVRSLVREYVGIGDPRVSAFRAHGDSSGVVDVYQHRENGSTGVVSTVTVRRSGRYWSVGSAAATDIVVENPHPLDTVGSPVVVDGRGRGYEATIVVTVREAGMGAGQELAKEPVIAEGGAGEDLGPFHAELAVAPTKSVGSILVNNDSGLDAVVQFAIVPVRFGATPTTGPQVSDEATVQVHWLNQAGEVVKAPRTVRKSAGVLKGAVQQLLFGPDSAERTAGLTSALDSGAAAVSVTVVLTDGTAVVDFGGGLPAASPSTSASAASAGLLRQLHATVFQFPAVVRAEYRVGGNCAAFWEWLQRGCTTVDRTHIGV